MVWVRQRAKLARLAAACTPSFQLFSHKNGLDREIGY
jgi:hypothetical protein